ncbi:MAG: indolepyruvate ferredoxin oxidoreductase subunit alpha [Desulfobacterales bacterium]
MHRLLDDSPGKKLFLLGNESIARGAIEAGVAMATTYPGTPSSEISMNFFDIAKETDLYFEYSINEKVALEVAAAAANSGVRSMCIMKHVGLNVAADALMTLAYLGVKAGLVIVCADDPFMFSSQNEQDNRYYAKMSGLPMVEASSVAEARELVRYAFEVSEQLHEPVIYRTTTRINHSTAVVELGDITPRNTHGDFVRDPFNYVAVPAVSRSLHAKLLENIKSAERLSDASPINRVEGTGDLGIICNGVSYLYVSDAVKELGIESDIRILRIGFSHPMPENTIKDFLRACKKVLVVEEQEPYMEEAVKAFAQEAGLTLSIAGKGEGLFSRLYEFDPAMVKRVIAGYFESIPKDAENRLELDDLPRLPVRPPSLCPGCSHRATFYAVKKAAENLDYMCTTDIGCYTLGFFPPLSMGDFLICMGSSFGTGCGFSKVTGKKVISFIGDSTFFHSGIPGLINAVFNRHNLTLVILDNGTTAMTGHQPHPGADTAQLNPNTLQQVSIESIVKAAGVPHVAVIQPYRVRKSIETVREALAVEGVSVIISRELCTLYGKNIHKRKARPFYVSDKCKNHRKCINELACPAFYLDGEAVRIDPALCAGCAVCAQICPENAILPIKNKSTR